MFHFINGGKKGHEIQTLCFQNQKYRQMEQNRKPRDKSMHLWALIFEKEAKIYNGEKTVSSSGAGKTGQLRV